MKMATTPGRNTVSGRELVAFVDRIERIREEKKALAADEKQVFAELQAKGFTPKRVRELLKIRTMKPLDRQEAEQELDMYLHVMGMAAEAPLFRAVGQMGVDLAVREQVIEAFKQLVPPGGEIIVKVGGSPVRLWREKEDGDVQAEDYREPPPPPPAGAGSSAGSATPRRTMAEAPDVDAEGAADLGRKAYSDNKPITANPFPFGDKRRPAWDAAWREASGTDGMGEE
jgi:uncharacterized protein (UPF0335 family)